MWIPCAPARAAFNCRASSAGLALPVGKARTNRPISSSVTEGKNWTLARPAAESNCANCFSAGEPSRGTPSSRSWEFVAPSNSPESVPIGMAVRSSCQAVWSCSMVRTCSYPYSRANFKSMLRLLTNASQAAFLESAFILRRLAHQYNYLRTPVYENAVRSNRARDDEVHEVM